MSILLPMLFVQKLVWTKYASFMANAVFKYLFFGILATLVYMVSRTLIFQLTKQGTLSAVLANAIAIIFAFFTNDIFVFNQETAGMATRFVKFVGARLLTLVFDLSLAFFLVDTYPESMGKVVGHSQAWVNGIDSLFAQVLIIVLNYIISKFFVFTDEKV